MKKLISRIFNVFFPCYFNESLCRDNLLGCRCGKNLFKSKTGTKGVDAVADPYEEVRDPLLGWLGETVGKKGEMYQGEMVAPMSKQEKESLGYLDEYAGAGASDIFGLGKAELAKTLGGQYDPTSSPYYQAVKAEAARNLETAQESISDLSAGGGRYWTGARLQEQREAATDVAQGLNTFLGGVAERERDRRLQAVPLAGEFAAREEEAPLRKTAALQTFGALPRVIQQAMDEAMYNEWNIATREWPLNIGQLTAGVQEAPLYEQRTTEPSRFRRAWDSMLSGRGISGAFD